MASSQHEAFLDNQRKTAIGELEATKIQLDAANNRLGTLTAASQSGRKIASADLDLLLGNNPCGLNYLSAQHGGDSSDYSIVKCFFPFLDAEYNDVAKAVFVINSFGDTEGLQYSFKDDTLIELRKFRTSAPGHLHLRALAGGEEFMLGLPSRWLGDYSAASFYEWLNAPGKEVGSVSLSFEKDFVDQRERSEFVRGHPGLRSEALSVEDAEDVDRVYNVYRARAHFAMPQSVRDAFINYWKEHFQLGSFILNLDWSTATSSAEDSGEVTIGSSEASSYRATVHFRLKDGLKLGFGGSSLR